jgi:hypothetical protein
MSMVVEWVHSRKKRESGDVVEVSSKRSQGSSILAAMAGSG